MPDEDERAANRSRRSPQHGHDPGRAEAHDGMPVHQDLIPSGLATNLVALRSRVMRGEARRGGRVRPKKRPLRHHFRPVLSFGPSAYLALVALDIPRGLPCAPGRDAPRVAGRPIALGGLGYEARLHP